MKSNLLHKQGNYFRFVQDPCLKLWAYYIPNLVNGNIYFTCSVRNEFYAFCKTGMYDCFPATAVTFWTEGFHCRFE